MKIIFTARRTVSVLGCVCFCIRRDAFVGSVLPGLSFKAAFPLPTDELTRRRPFVPMFAALSGDWKLSRDPID